MKKFMYFLMSALMVLAAVSCKKSPGNPSVKTLPPTEIDAYSARLQAKIDFAGVSWASVNFGFYWGTNEDAEGTYTMGEGTLDEANAYSAKIEGLTPETDYWYKAFIEIDGQPFTGEVMTFTTGEVPVVAPEAVDLGIVVNGKTIKWGSFNLGATKPEEYGDYYAWGETEPKEDYSWSTYKFRTSGDSWDNVKFSKYITNDSYGSVDNITVLQRGEITGETVDDAAREKLHGKWRMPTYAEWEALLNQCKCISTTQNGINGRLVTADNGNSIFLPCAGNWHVTSLLVAGTVGCYWSSSLYMPAPYSAWAMRFNSDNKDMALYDRYDGLTIRPVWEE